MAMQSREAANELYHEGFTDGENEENTVAEEELIGSDRKNHTLLPHRTPPHPQSRHPVRVRRSGCARWQGGCSP